MAQLPGGPAGSSASFGVEHPQVAITGRTQVLVEDHGGIRRLESQRIVVGGAGRRLTTQGEGLSIAFIAKDEPVVRGRILCINRE
ncbi:MAG TPA: hypothetical protein DCM14_06615 [Clostridiales bacterium UBA8153]|nr:hypothetical protein [Clostridiales bacterium UBA8153]